MPTLLNEPGCNLGALQRLPPSCAPVGGFAIGAPVALLWQHNANPSVRGVCARCWLVTGRWRRRSQHYAPDIASGRGWLAGDWPSTGGVLNITAAAWTVGFQWWLSGDITRTQNVSEYTLVLALCLVVSCCETTTSAHFKVQHFLFSAVCKSCKNNEVSQ